MWHACNIYCSTYCCIHYSALGRSGCNTTYTMPPTSGSNATRATTCSTVRMQDATNHTCAAYTLLTANCCALVNDETQRCIGTRRTAVISAFLPTGGCYAGDPRHCDREGARALRRRRFLRRKRADRKQAARCNRHGGYSASERGSQRTTAAPQHADACAYMVRPRIGATVGCCC